MPKSLDRQHSKPQRRGREEWSRLMPEYEVGDATQREFCAQHGLAYRALVIGAGEYAPRSHPAARFPRWLSYRFRPAAGPGNGAWSWRWATDTRCG